MNLVRGFHLYAPDKLITWRLRDLELEDLLDGHPLKKIKKEYYTLSCEPLIGLHCVVGFHLHKYSVLSELEFFMNFKSFDELPRSYQVFQSHFETEFGSPTKTEKGNEGFLFHEWLVPGARIVHHVFDRFGPEQRMRIEKI